MADLNAVITRLNDRLLRLEGELFVLRSLARATLTAGDDHAARMRKLVEAAKVALDDEATRPLDKPTRKYVDAVRGTNARIVDTRKTIPGLRMIDKYAVVVGGGRNRGFETAISVAAHRYLAVQALDSARRVRGQSRTIRG